MTLQTVEIPDGRIWLRVANADGLAPLDPTYAQHWGGRWNPPRSYPTLYLNANVETARLQIEGMCRGTPVTPDDLADDAYVLVAATVPLQLVTADAVSAQGLVSLGLPESYPLDAQGGSTFHLACSAIGAKLHAYGLRGVWCRSACTSDGGGREFAWFTGTERATAVWDAPLPLGDWRYAETWHDVALVEQPNPR